MITDGPLVEPGSPGPKRRRTVERRTTCPYCQVKLKGRELTCCDKPLCQKRRRMHYDTMTRQRTFAERSAVKGRQCPDCLAFDHETTFVINARCVACSQQQLRNGRCEACQSIKMADADGIKDCWRCNPPGHLIEVLWECTDGRLRRMWRRIDGGRVKVGAHKLLVRRNPFRIVVEPKVWVPVRR